MIYAIQTLLLSPTAQTAVNVSKRDYSVAYSSLEPWYPGSPKWKESDSAVGLAEIALLPRQTARSLWLMWCKGLQNCYC